VKGVIETVTLGDIYIRVLEFSITNHGKSEGSLTFYNTETLVSKRQGIMGSYGNRE
jgi:hypothetical protein